MDDRRKKALNGCISSITDNDLIRINLCGMEYVTLKSTLEQFPTTLLGNEKRRQGYYVDCLGSYYFDRHRECFEAVLYYYQSGGWLVRPTNIPMDLFSREVRFFGIAEDVLLNLQSMEGYVPLVEEKVEQEEMPKNYLQRIVWKVVDQPESSLAARCIALMSISMILLSITTFCIETIPQYRSTLYDMDIENHESDQTRTCSVNETALTDLHCKPYTNPKELRLNELVNIVEVLTIVWFTLEYMVRLTSSPNKWRFLKSFVNIIDLCAILPFFIILAIKSSTIGLSSLPIIRVIRLIRVFRVFKLSRHSLGLQVLGNTLKSSVNELGMILFMLSFSVVIFSSAMYFAEHVGDNDTFKSIPDAFWYTIVTITTVGYGDHVPLTMIGKCIGAVCAISGVLTVAMVVPVVVTNFEFFYKRDRISAAQRERYRLSMRESHRVVDTSEVASLINGPLHFYSSV